MPTSLTLSTAIILGLLGSAHCLGMCGGIAASIAMTQSRRYYLVAYNVGRIFSYALAGFLVGSLGFMIKDPVTGLILRTGAGLLLIAMGLYIGQWWKGLTRIEKLGQGLWSIIRPAASKLLPVQTLSQALLLGFFWGWLPCGLIYSTLIWSASAQHPLESAVLMFTFGLGTLPAMLATGLLANEVKQLLQRQWIHTVAGIVIIAFGIYTIPWTGLTH